MSVSTSARRSSRSWHGGRDLLSVMGAWEKLVERSIGSAMTFDCPWMLARLDKRLEGFTGGRSGKPDDLGWFAVDFG